MRRLLTACALLSLTGCLDPGDPLLGVRDTNAPRVESTDPAANGQIATDGTLNITFSEYMDARTLRPGVAVFLGRDEVPLDITVPAPAEGDEDVERGDISYTVMVKAASNPFAANASYTLVLRTVLTDYEGNALAEEVRVPFRTGP
jgi:Bacterial Ig-like domain